MYPQKGFETKHWMIVVAFSVLGLYLRWTRLGRRPSTVDVFLLCCAAVFFPPGALLLSFVHCARAWMPQTNVLAVVALCAMVAHVTIIHT